MLLLRFTSIRFSSLSRDSPLEHESELDSERIVLLCTSTPRNSRHCTASLLSKSVLDKALRGRDARAAVLADDQRQMEMEFGRQADLEVEAASENDVARVQDAVSDLERLEAEMSGSEANVSETGEKFGLG